MFVQPCVVTGSCKHSREAGPTGTEVGKTVWGGAGTPLLLTWCYKEIQLKLPRWEMFVLTHRVRVRPGHSRVVVLV